jgi:hypothetical protein
VAGGPLGGCLTRLEQRALRVEAGVASTMEGCVDTGHPADEVAAKQERNVVGPAAEKRVIGIGADHDHRRGGDVLRIGAVFYDEIGIVQNGLRYRAVSDGARQILRHPESTRILHVLTWEPDRRTRVADLEGRNVHGLNQRASGDRERSSLSFDGRAMRDRRHAYERGPLGWCSCRWNTQPDTRLQMDPDRLVGIADVIDGLQVRNAVQEDVTLGPCRD